MSFLLYIHVADDQIVLPSTPLDTISDVIQRAEAAYSSLFRLRPPLTIDAIQDDRGCFLPPSVIVEQVLRHGAHIHAVIHTEVSLSNVDLPQFFASWDRWLSYMAQVLCALVSSSRKEDLAPFPIFHIFNAFACSSNMQGRSQLLFNPLRVSVVLQSLLQALDSWMHCDLAGSAALFAQLLSSPFVLSHDSLRLHVLKLVHVFCSTSRDAVACLAAHDLIPRLLKLADAHGDNVEAVVAALQDHALLRPKPASASSTAPPIAIQELLFSLHGKQPKSIDVATRYLLELSTSSEAWTTAIGATTCEPSLFAELLHLAHGNAAFEDTVIPRILETMTNVLAFQAHLPLVQDPHAIEILVALTTTQAMATVVLQHTLDLNGHLGYTNVAGFVGMLQNPHAPTQKVGASALLAALDGKAKVNPAHIHERVLQEMCRCHIPALVDALYAPDTSTRLVVLQVLNLLLQEEDVRRLVVELGCISAFVSLLVDHDATIGGQRQAAKALAKLALSSHERRQAVADAMEYVVSRDAMAGDSVVAFYVDLMGKSETAGKAPDVQVSRSILGSAVKMGSKTSKPIVERQDTANEKAITGNQGASFQTSNRKCTDLLCTLLFVVFWIGMIVISIIAFTRGKPERLAYGMDFQGRICGTTGTSPSTQAPYDLTAYKYLAYPRLAQDLNAMAVDPKFDPKDPANLKKLYGVCVAACPSSHSANGTQQYIHALQTYAAGQDVVAAASQPYASGEDTTSGSPFKIVVNTSNVLFRCLELPTTSQINSVRCVDDCVAGSNASMCGPNATFFNCGAAGCTKYASVNMPSCMNLQTKQETLKTSSSNSSPIFDSLYSGWFMVAQWIGDVQKASIPILICGVLVSLVLGFLWLLCLRYCAGFFVWLTVLLVVAILLFTTFFLAYKGELLNNSMIATNLAKTGLSQAAIDQVTGGLVSASAAISFAQAQVKYWTYAAYIFMGVDVLVLLVLIFMCSRIKIAVGIIREASKAIGRMPFLVLFPIVPVIFVTAFIVYWIIAAAFLATSGNITATNVLDTVGNATGLSHAQYALQDDNVLNYLLIYHVFGFLWTAQFLQAVGYTTMAGAVCEYYWTLNKSSMSRVPILSSFYRTLRYHIGSMAFGSLVIAIIQFARLVLEYVDQKLKSAQQNSTVVKVAMFAFKCCLWCFEKCMKFLNKNAYIMVAMKGSSFCSAMKESFELLLANAARVATVSVVSMFLILLGKIFITAFSCMMLFLFISNPPSGLPSFFTDNLDQISSPVFPLLVCGVLSFAIASFFLDVYETTIDTILLCFCEDCSVNKATGTYYMSDELLAYVDGPAKKHAFSHYKSAEA
ncbi:unnamed protein product [Aphanomyces euteiches]